MKRIVWIVAILTIVTVFFLAITGVTSIDSLAALYESEGFFSFCSGCLQPDSDICLLDDKELGGYAGVGSDRFVVDYVRTF